MERLPRTDWRGALTPRGWGFVAAAAVALMAAQVMGRRDLLHLAVFLALVPAGALVASLLVRPSVTVLRRPRPEVVEAGQSTEVALSLRHSGLLSGRMAMTEQLPASLGTGPTFVYPGASIGRDGASNYRYELGCPRRGLYWIGPVEARHSDPFGLAERRSRIGASTRLTVTPAPVALPAAALAGLRGAEGIIAARIQSVPSEDDVMTREYRHGDPMRRVHWAATARHGELMVRQEESAVSPEATIVMDLRGSAFPDAGQEDSEDRESPAFEWAVTAVVSVAAHLSELGYSLRLLEPGGGLALARSSSAPEPDTAEYTGRDGLALIAEGLAAIGPAEQAAGPAGFSDRLLDRLEGHRHRGPIVAVLGRTTTEQARELASASGFAERALAVVVVPRAGSSRGAVDALRDAGWRAAEATPRASLPRVWAALTAEDAPLDRGERRPGTAGGERSSA
ncbi:hypothetical protein SA2016_1458 [Sinomonas atrocyanea]|uniref:DUF58 domain-containing protein n=1 Tax=Sinomonas atrocyanea TaxID=37927 RepID=A0A126ZZ34_9MICC|nr:DUF58 domain-containing protein [Sinomonas atrocyanea]AMM32136.1 hypothetical protein SA2016_1458 [Sinomonas atrocyanea]GEB66274.1 hypothetical protein SAT01_37220 [Sinomonas atrocyanea]GGG77555.1 hypothetical protein GCM10007172_33170 [Sinomonas atrocyanea]